jgi:hypothetical protein
MMNHKTCKTCAAYCVAAANARQGSCRRHAPQAIMVGMQEQHPLAAAGTPGRSMFNGHKTPIVQGFFPPVGENCWCLDWRESAIGPMIEVTAEVDAAPPADVVLAGEAA